MPFSPLGRGFLAGRVASVEGLADDGVRRSRPRFAEGALECDLAIVAKPEELAVAEGVTAGQLALAWVRHRGDDVVPVPGTRWREYLEENLAAPAVELTPDGLAAVEAVAPAGRFAGSRHDATGPAFVDG